MGLCTAFVFSALVEFTIVNFWFRKQRYQPNLFNTTDDVKGQGNSTSNAVSKSNYAYHNNPKDGKLLGNNYLCKYHRRKQLLAMNKERNGKIQPCICYTFKLFLAFILMTLFLTFSSHLIIYS